MANRMKILVAYDGSECADAALDDLRRAGLPSDAQVKVLSVVENWLPPPSALEIIEHIDRDQEYLALARRGGTGIAHFAESKPVNAMTLFEFSRP